MSTPNATATESSTTRAEYLDKTDIAVELNQKERLEWPGRAQTSPAAVIGRRRQISERAKPTATTLGSKPSSDVAKKSRVSPRPTHGRARPIRRVRSKSPKNGSTSNDSDGAASSPSTPPRIHRSQQTLGRRRRNVSPKDSPKSMSESNSSTNSSSPSSSRMPRERRRLPTNPSRGGHSPPAPPSRETATATAKRSPERRVRSSHLRTRQDISQQSLRQSLQSSRHHDVPMRFRGMLLVGQDHKNDMDGVDPTLVVATDDTAIISEPSSSSGGEDLTEDDVPESRGSTASSSSRSNFLGAFTGGLKGAKKKKKTEDLKKNLLSLPKTKPSRNGLYNHELFSA